jgi:cell division protein ZapE
MTINQFLPTGFKLDEVQLKILGKLEETASNIDQQSFFKFFKPTLPKQGIYMYGGVGRGKTMLMLAFYHRMKCSKQMVHYQNFMQLVHKDIHKLQMDNSDKLIARLAKNYSDKGKILCLDEFEIKDITDAMIIKKLFIELNKNKVFIFITSNTLPNNLYKDGLQRESFLPFIDFIYEKFEILHLDNNHDYRLDKLSELNNRVIYPINSDSNLKIKNIISKLTDDKIEIGSIEVFGRRISFAKTHGDTLITDFAELFMRDLGYSDYVNICQKFSTIILQDVPVIEQSNSDLITRFINFIDNAYFYKVLLFITLNVSPEKIYTDGKRLDEFKRTISRLYEMNSNSYFGVIYDQ